MVFRACGRLKSNVISLQPRENAIAGASTPSYATMIAVKTNRAPQVKRPSIARRALFNFRASRRVARDSDFDNPFTEGVKTRPERDVIADLGRRVWAWSITPRWVSAMALFSDDERRMSGPLIEWRGLLCQRVSSPSSVDRAIKRAKDVPEGILRAPGLRSPNRSRPRGIDGWRLSHLRHPRLSRWFCFGEPTCRR